MESYDERREPHWRCMIFSCTLTWKTFGYNIRLKFVYEDHVVSLLPRTSKESRISCIHRISLSFFERMPTNKAWWQLLLSLCKGTTTQKLLEWKSKIFLWSRMIKINAHVLSSMMGNATQFGSNFWIRYCVLIALWWSSDKKELYIPCVLVSPKSPQKETLCGSLPSVTNHGFQLSWD